MILTNLRRRLCLLVAIGVVGLAGVSSVQANTFVQFTTNMGNFKVELFDSAVPTTVANFLSYVNSGQYDNTMVHRSTHVSSDGLGLIQGGGYDTQENAIPTSAPIPLEAALSNVRGTIGMGRTSVPDSARSQWFINTVDNSPFLDAQPGSPGYAVFGQVIGNGMDVIDAINALQTFAYAVPFNQVPLRNFTTNDFDNSADPLPHVVTIISVQVVAAPEPSSGVLATIGLSVGAFVTWRARRGNRLNRRDVPLSPDRQ